MIHLQDQDTLTYKSLLNHCKQLEAQCEQFKQAQAQGRAHLTSITAASASHSSLHANTQSTTTHQACQRCDNSHPHANCPAFDHECYNCHGTGHLTALCKRPHANRHPVDNSSKHRELRGRSHRSSNHKQSSRSIEAGNLTENTLTTPEEVSAPDTAHHKTITREDHPNEENTAPHHTGIRLAILNHLSPNPKLMKVKSSPMGHLMATDLSIQHWS